MNNIIKKFLIFLSISFFIMGTCWLIFSCTIIGFDVIGIRIKYKLIGSGFILLGFLLVFIIAYVKKKGGDK